MYSDLVSIPSNCTSECKLRLVSLQRRQSSGTPTGPYLLSPLRHTDLCSNLIAGHTWFSSQQKKNFFFLLQEKFSKFKERLRWSPWTKPEFLKISIFFPQIQFLSKNLMMLLNTFLYINSLSKNQLPLWLMKSTKVKRHHLNDFCNTFQQFVNVIFRQVYG